MEFNAEQLTQLSSPFDDAIGLRFESASGERVVATVEVTPHLHQPTGIVHGGVYATMIETATSVGATIWAGEHVGAFAAGIANSTDFLRAVSTGTLRVTANAIQQGRTLQLWEAAITDEQDRVVAHGKVRLINRTVGHEPERTVGHRQGIEGGRGRAEAT